MLGFFMGMGMAPELHPDVWKSFFMKYAPKTVPGISDVGVIDGDGDGPRTSPRCLVGVKKSFK